jgi:hypothetical protein
MFGERILARSLSQPSVSDKHGNIWQYHSQSDRHSKIACWGVLFDLICSCPLLREHIAKGRVVFGINHAMTDFVSRRQKNLDLVVCTPRTSEASRRPRNFRALVSEFDITLISDEQSALDALPPFIEGPVGDVLLALESKACMTAHVKAAPRLFDELTSAAQCINGSAEGAIAVGHTIVNCAPIFISTVRNKRVKTDAPFEITKHPLPESVNKIVETIRRLPIRGHATERGYDAIAITALNLINDGTDVSLAPSPPALASDDPLNYERMVRRIAGIYDTRFQRR